MGSTGIISEYSVLMLLYHLLEHRIQDFYTLRAVVLVFMDAKG